MALSSSTINKLAEVLTPEVLDYIFLDERWIELMMEIIPDAIQEKLGQLDGDLCVELAMCIMDRISLCDRKSK